MRGRSPADVAVACLQNGVDNERQVLRRTPHVYAVPVMLPATHLQPGVVEASSAPVTGILDVGCYPIGGQRRGGGSSWQSPARGTGSIEADLLNGEIVLLGRLHCVTNPVNELLQRVANELAHRKAPPASMTEADLLARLA